jgi:hypothetical protein
MTRRESLLRETDDVPDSVLDEVADFVHFLKARIVRDGMATAVASESSLKKDWLRPEEDDAWQEDVPDAPGLVSRHA